MRDDQAAISLLFLCVIVLAFALITSRTNPESPAACNAHWEHIQPDTLRYVREYPYCKLPEDTV